MLTLPLVVRALSFSVSEGAAEEQRMGIYNANLITNPLVRSADDLLEVELLDWVPVVAQVELEAASLNLLHLLTNRDEAASFPGLVALAAPNDILSGFQKYH